MQDTYTATKTRSGRPGWTELCLYCVTECDALTYNAD